MESNNGELTANKQNEYNYGLDFLRVLSMLSIICLHIVNAGGGYTNSNSYIVNFVWTVFYVIIVSSVNVFAMLSGYLYVDKKVIRNRNIVNLLLTIAFYYIVITACYYTGFAKAINPKELLLGIFPPFFGKNWYWVCYLIMFFCIPYLNLFINNISKNTHQKLLMVLFVLLSIVPTLGFTDFFKTSNGYSPWWLIYCYLIGGYIKKSGGYIQRSGINISLFVL